MEKKISKAEEALEKKLIARTLSGFSALYGDDQLTEETQDPTETEISQDGAQEHDQPLLETEAPEASKQRKKKRDPLFPEDIEQLALIRRERYKAVGRPRKDDKDRISATANTERVTTILTHETANKIRAIAYNNAIQVKDVMETFLQRSIKDYEDRKGEVKIGKRKRKDAEDLL